MNIQVITASKHPEPLDLAPNVMYVYTKEDIHIYGFHSVMDVLTMTPGFQTFHKDLQYVAQVRGIAPNDNEKITLMVNGHSLNNLTEPDFLNGPINLDNVDKIEIIVGPGSVLYGSSTLAATINLITKIVDGAEVNLATGFSRATDTFSAAPMFLKRKI